MRIIRNGFKSLTRRPSKTVLLSVIFFILFSLTFSGLIINGSVENSKEKIKDNIGAVVEYTLDYNKFFEEQFSMDDFDPDSFTDGESDTGEVNEFETSSFEMPSISRDTVDKMGSSKYVRKVYLSEYYNWSISENLELVKSDSMMGFFGGSNSIPVSAINTNYPISFETTNQKLDQGKYFSDEELSSGAKVAMISKELATKNNLRIGDMIELNDEYFSIVGTYSDGTDKNTVYVPYKTASSIADEYNSSVVNGTVHYMLNDADNVENFVNENENLLTSEYHVLKTNLEEVEKVTQPLESVSSMTMLLVSIVLVAGVLIIIAVVSIFVRDRKKEVGLLLAYGDTKLQVFAQYILEIVIISVVAFLISLGTSTMISKGVSNWIKETQFEVEESNDDEFGGIMIIGGSDGQVNNDQLLEESFTLALDSKTIMRMFIISIGLVIISSSVPLTVISKYKPREILQD